MRPIVIAILVALVPVAAAQTLLYAQDWEAGAGGWASRFPNDPVVLVGDPDGAGHGAVHRLTRATYAGNYFSPPIAVSPGQAYCFSAWVKWIGGGWPFLGFDRYAPHFIGETWAVGHPSETPGISAVRADTTQWAVYVGKASVGPASSIKLKTELWDAASKGGPHEAYLDDIRVHQGKCYTGSGRAAGAVTEEDGAIADTGFVGPALAAQAYANASTGSGVASASVVVGEASTRAEATADRATFDAGLTTVEVVGATATLDVACGVATSDASVASIVVNGAPIALPPGAIPPNTRLEVPGLATITLHEVSEIEDGATVVAVRIVGSGLERAYASATAIHGCL